MKTRPYALRFAPDLDTRIIACALTTWIWRWHCRGFGGRVGWAPPILEYGSVRDPRVAIAYHLRADAAAWRAFQARGLAISIDDVVERLGGIATHADPARRLI
jgi:hypothetical protein